MGKHLRSAAVATIAALALALPVNSTWASTTVLGTGSGGSFTTMSADDLSAGLASDVASFAPSPGDPNGYWCRMSSIAATITSNPVAPATATTTLAHTFGACTGSGDLADVQSVTAGGTPYAMAISSGGAVTVSGKLTITLVFTIPIRAGRVSPDSSGTRITCVYGASSVSGTFSNADSSITVANQLYSRSSGPGDCPPASYFSARYGPLVDVSQAGSPKVVVS